MKPKTTWILVADGARARVLARHGGDSHLEQIPGGSFSGEVHRASELGTERPGKVRESANAAHHAIAPHADWTHEEKRAFAHRLAEFLEQKAIAKAFDHFVLVAEPHFLGDLRGVLGAETQKRLTGALDKDFTHLPLEEVESRLTGAALL